MINLLSGSFGRTSIFTPKVAELCREDAKAATRSKKGHRLSHMVVHLVHHTTTWGTIYIVVYGNGGLEVVLGPNTRPCGLNGHRLCSLNQLL